MARTNGKSDVDPAQLDAEHELPAADETEETESTSSAEVSPRAAATTGDFDLQRLKAERDSLLDRLARLQAEFENARKRATREQQDFREYAVADALKTLLPVLDSFERALQTSPEQSEIHKGVELIYKQLQDALTKLGLQPMVATGQPFDPHVHQAIEMVDTTEAADHQVLEELQRGYKLKDRLLRPAMVKVARNPRS
ncbi:MAG: nucleotide exchange factor GrpE [Acidobacteriia bacterium]|nr:nucleotide exchange factor GrpE [Terriglobia bacterium]